MSSACAVLCFRGTEGHDSSDLFCKILRATLIENVNFARFRNGKSAKTQGLGTMSMRSVTSYPQKVPKRVAGFRPCSRILPFTGPKACSKRSTALIVRLFSVFARPEAVHDMHFVPLRAVFLHQGSWEGHRLRPTGRNVSGTWMHL